MMKLTYKKINGTKFTEEFVDVAEFLALQSEDIALVPDNYRVEELLIDDEKVEFAGTVGELYFELIKK